MERRSYVTLLCITSLWESANAEPPAERLSLSITGGRVEEEEL